MQSVKAAGVLERFQEFDRVAVVLAMSTEECLGILNLPRQVYTLLRDGNVSAFEQVKPELERRLSYALPVMRRLAASRPTVRIPAAMGLALA